MERVGVIARALEGGEDAALASQLQRRLVRLLLHEARHLLAQRQRVLGVVRDAQLEERVVPAHHTEADLARQLRRLVYVRHRIAVHVDHVVQEARAVRDYRGQALPVEARVLAVRPGGRPSGRLHEPRQVKRPQVARFVRQKRLLSAVVDVQPVRVEGVDSGYLHIEDVFFAIGRDRSNGGDETLAVEPSSVMAETEIEPRPLGTVLEADEFSVAAEILAGDHKFVLGLVRVQAGAATTIRHEPFSRCAPVLVEAAGDAEAEEHALDGLKHWEVALRQANADALELRSLDRAVAVEEAADEATIEGGRLPLDVRGDCLASGRGAERHSELADSAQNKVPGWPPRAPLPPLETFPPPQP